MQTSRRTFLRALGGAAGLAILRPDWRGIVAAANRAVSELPPDEIARNEDYWFAIQQAFDIDRSIINLNNGGVCPAPRVVLSAMRRHDDYANNFPARGLWKVQDPQVETVRTRLARAFGCDREEMAITRNASESLQIAINGIDLEPGDEILTTTHDYPRMINTIKQRALREGIVLRQVSPPIPPRSMDELYDLFERNITRKTKVILVSHVVNITGEIYPVRRICRAARRRGIRTIVDGAHAFGQFVFKCGDLECDYYGVSLHKWITAPIGTGFLHVRRELIGDLWPLQAAPDPRSTDIRKFEEIGTHPDGPRLAIAEALTFWEGIGPARKESRLRYLRDYWARRLREASDRIRLHTNLSPEHSCAIGTVQIVGVDSRRLAEHLWDRHKILVTEIVHDEFEGIRITPNVYTTLAELDIFCEAMETVIRRGLPASQPAERP